MLFFVSPQLDKQRLKLASVGPALLKVYTENGMALEQLLASSLGGTIHELTAWRKAAGLTRAALAQKAGIRTSTV